MKQSLSILFVVLIIMSCNKKKIEKPIKEKPTQIVLISKYSPEPYKHYLKQDSLGGNRLEKSGPYTPISSPTFSYFDSQNNISNWTPEANRIDTLVVPYYSDYMELSTRNRYTSIPNTYLVKNGDTIIFEYKNKIPVATIANRNVNTIELNYNNYRLKTLFNNKYTSHHNVFLGLLISKEKSPKKTSIGYYKKAIEDKKKELVLLDSLQQQKLISKVNYEYRVSVLNQLIEKHKSNKIVKKWIDNSKSVFSEEHIEKEYALDLSKTDSLLMYSYFRDHLNTISKYNLSFIEEDNGGSGGFYIDSRIRFDAIIKDKRFTQTAKNFLLFSAYKGIIQDFKSKDKERYFKKLQKHTTNRLHLSKLQQDYNLDFGTSELLILTTLTNDTIVFSDVLKKNKGKWLYIDFWGSWCKPCRETMPEANRLKETLKDKNVEFIYLSLNDKKDKWKAALKANKILKSQNYFIENSNTSKVIEDLGIKTIPHFLIYNPAGELVNGYAKRPGRGAKEQLQKLMIDNKSL